MQRTRTNLVQITRRSVSCVYSCVTSLSVQMGWVVIDGCIHTHCITSVCMRVRDVLLFTHLIATAFTPVPRARVEMRLSCLIQYADSLVCDMAPTKQIHVDSWWSVFSTFNLIYTHGQVQKVDDSQSLKQHWALTTPSIQHKLRSSTYIAVVTSKVNYNLSLSLSRCFNSRLFT